MVKEHQKNGSLAYYWEHLKSKISDADTLEDLVRYRRGLIKTTGILTYKTHNGHLIPHRYNQVSTNQVNQTNPIDTKA
ncbi:hypothetical protein C1N51_28725 (plasmid) [Vibrio campbellii]|nr:hypothetical protein C1N51_28725 [Vibrio campbellii]